MTARPDPVAQGVAVTGRVRRVLFTAPERGFAVIAMDGPDGERVTARGPLAHLQVDREVEVRGVWRTHPAHGRQLEADSGVERDPADERGVVAYLTRLPGIGGARARTLHGRYGDGLFPAMDADADAVLRTLPGVGRERAARAAAAWTRLRGGRDLHVLLARHGLARLVPALVDRHGDSAFSVVRDDPFVLTELDGVGFLSADRVARDLGVAVPMERRAEAGITHVLDAAEGDGHTHLPLAELADRVDALLHDEVDVHGPLLALTNRGTVTVDEGRVYRSRLHRLEVGLAAGLAARASLPPPDVDGPLGGGDSLTAEQRQAVRWALTAPLSVVTGGPGTGKSTLTTMLVRECARRRLRLGLCAPTGRAARRLTEITGHPAVTVHRLLEWHSTHGPARNAVEPLDVDVLVVDECSMLTLELAALLVDAVPVGARLVMVGDVDQLPPVGAGRPFADLIESGTCPVTRLAHVFRQSARSLIVRAAHDINSGRAPAPAGDDPDVDRDLFVLGCDDPTGIVPLVTDLVARRLPDAYGLDPDRDIQVLAPMYRGPAGIDALNASLRDRLATGDPLPGGRYRRGEKLIATRNDYEAGLVNGQLVHVVAVEPTEADGGRVCVETDDDVVWLDADRARGLRPGYATSVHRAQGSETPAVVVVCHTSSAIMLTRALLYTAVTRSRRLCVIVGQRRAIAAAARRADIGRRHSGLRERLRDMR